MELRINKERNKNENLRKMIEKNIMQNRMSKIPNGERVQWEFENRRLN